MVLGRWDSHMQRLKTKQKKTNKTIQNSPLSTPCFISCKNEVRKKKVKCAIINYETTRQDTEEMLQDIARD